MNAFHFALDMSLNKTLSLAGLSLVFAGFASAEVESSISAGYNSDYVYRGVNLGADQLLILGFLEPLPVSTGTLDCSTDLVTLAQVQQQALSSLGC